VDIANARVWEGRRVGVGALGCMPSVAIKQATKLGPSTISPLAGKEAFATTPSDSAFHWSREDCRRKMSQFRTQLKSKAQHRPAIWHFHNTNQMHLLS